MADKPIIAGEQAPAQNPGSQHLQAIEQGILGKMQPDHAEQVEQVVVKAHTILYNEATRDKVWKGFQDIDDDSDPRKIAHGVAAILTLINRKAETIPVELMVPAGALVAIEVLKFLDEANMLAADTAFTGNVIEELIAALMQKMNMGPKQPPQQPQEIPGGVSPSQRQGVIAGAQQPPGVPA